MLIDGLEPFLRHRMGDPLLAQLGPGIEPVGTAVLAVLSGALIIARAGALGRLLPIVQARIFEDQAGDMRS